MIDKRHKWPARTAWIIAAAAALPCWAQTLDKGHRILLERGLQLQGMVANYDQFHLPTFQAAGFTAAHWIWDSTNSWLGPPPGISWARWVRSPQEMPFLPSEQAYASTLIALQIGDEQNLNDPTVRAQVAQWYAAIRDSFPNTILFCNSYGGQVNNLSLGDFIQTSRPDMLSFDTYPFRPGEPAGGSPTSLYGDMQRYRKWALAYGLPYGLYTQTFHDSTVRDASESELRLHYFAGAAFGYTFFNCFTYNTGASSLFTSPGGDSHPTPGYSHLQEIHRRLRLLSPALTRLVNTDVRFINGQQRDSSSGEAVDNPTPIDVLNWQVNVNDPYLRGWVVTNLGTKNEGLPGDVWLSWFRVLDESFDGASTTGEIYFMVTNGLSDANGSAIDCRQQIQLNFQLGGDISSVLRLSQALGQAEVIELPVIPNSGGRRQLTLTCDGGTGELFKFHTGAPFVGVPMVPDATPPAPVVGFAVQASVEQATLAWTNPTSSDFEGTLVRRKLGSLPTGVTDGELVIDLAGVRGVSQQFVDLGVPGTRTWHYAAFAHDGVPNYAAAATGSGLVQHHADLDLDNDVDQSDFSLLQRCLSGDRVPYPMGCSTADQDGDGDVDSADVLRFAECMEGAGMPPGC